MRKPVIGVMPLMDVERESYWMLPGYMEGILEAGGIPVMFPLTPDRAVLGQLAESCDGFLFTGGHDVSPEIYGEENARILSIMSHCFGNCDPIITDDEYIELV